MIAGARGADIAPSGLSEPFISSLPGFDFGADYAAAYLAGDPARAVAVAESAAAMAESALERALINLDTLYMCERIDDYTCVEVTLFKLLSELEQINGEAHEDIQRQAQVWIARYDIWRGEIARATELVEILSQRSQYEYSRSSYLILQNVIRWTARTKENYADARRAASRLIIRLLWDTDFSSLEKAQYLSSVLQNLLFSGDSFGAHRFYSAFDSFIRAELESDVVELAIYLSFSATLNAEVGNFDEAIARTQLAKTVADKTTIPRDQKNTFLSEGNNLEVIAKLLAGDVHAARTANDENATVRQRQVIIERGYFSTSDELVSTVIDLLVQRVAGESLDARLMPLFDEPTQLSFFGIEGNFFEPYRLFGRGLLLSSNGDDGQEDLFSAAVVQLLTAEKRQRSFANLYPLPNVAERIAIGMAIQALVQRPDLSIRNQDLIISGFDYLTRTPAQFRGDSLVHISGLELQSERRRFQSYLRLSSREIVLELQAVELALQSENDEIVGLKVNVLSALNELSEATALLRVSASGPTTEVQDIAPTSEGAWIASVSDIQHYMREDEAVIGNLVSFGNLLRVCVRRDSFQLKLTPGTPEMGAQVMADSRILRAALTATHQPSEELDSQFPVQAAIRMHDFLLGDFGDCLAGVTQISYVPIPDISDIPIQSLLERAPPLNSTGYDLANADWVARKYSISYLSALREYGAAARLAERAQKSFKFLGVGDPVLSADMNLQGRAQLMAGLGELPETGDELRAIQATFSDATILTREEATEERVRSEYLAAYSVLSFATHGVTSGELPGYYDPGLVLTPQIEGGNLIVSDGFFSAAEIAVLSLDARLVILSGCNTGNVDPALFGTGVSGLAEAFSIAGVPTIVASLWSVDSEATEELMTIFLGELARNPEEGVARNLSSAVNEFLQSVTNSAFLHPRFWSAFAVFGAGKIEAISSQEEPAANSGFTSFNRIDVSGGRTAGVASLPNGNVIVSRLGYLNAERPTSFLEITDPEQGVVWQVNDSEFGASEVIATSENFYTAAYKFAAYNYATGIGTVTPVVRSYDLLGTLLWEWHGETLDGQRLIPPVMNMDSQGRLLVLLQGDAPTQDQLAPTLLRFNEEGNVSVLWTLPPFNIGQAITSVNYSEGNSGPLLLISVHPNDVSRNISDLNVSDLGIPRICFLESSTYVFSSSSFERVPEYSGTYQYLFINKTRAVAGHVIAVGRIDVQCNSGALWYGWHGEITPQRAMPAYVEARLPGSSFMDFLVQEDDILLMGHWTRRHSEVLRPVVIENQYVAGEREAFENDEMFVTSLQDAARYEGGAVPNVQFQTFLGAGLSSYGEGIISHGELVRVWGRVGEYPFTVDLDWH